MSKQTSSYFEQLKEIRQSYIEQWSGMRGQDPYKFYDWINFFSPIERNVWSHIRYVGLPFFPQFPVGRYYLDFADPFKRIGIEVDGKVHTQEAVQKKDERRTKYLHSKGWKIYRIPGWKTYKTYRDYFPENDYEFWEDEERVAETERIYYRNCAEGNLRRIQQRHYQPRPDLGDAPIICLLDISDEELARYRMTPEKVAKNKIAFAYE